MQFRYHIMALRRTSISVRDQLSSTSKQLLQAKPEIYPEAFLVTPSIITDEARSPFHGRLEAIINIWCGAAEELYDMAAHGDKDPHVPFRWF